MKEYAEESKKLVLGMKNCIILYDIYFEDAKV